MINGIGGSYINAAYYKYSRISSNIKIPTVPQMCAKGRCKSSEKELTEKIVELAKSDAASGKDSRHGETVKGFTARIGTAEWRMLRDDFISFASPDRMGIVKNTLFDLANKANSMHLKCDKGFDLLKALFANSKKFGPNVDANFIEFKDEYGKVIARYSEPNGWSVWSTDAECARNAAFDELWNQASDIMSEYSYTHRRQTEKLHDRINTAEKSEEKNDASITKMIAEYDEYLRTALEKLYYLSIKPRTKSTV